MYIASNDIKSGPSSGLKIYVFQNTFMTSHECGATLWNTCLPGECKYVCLSCPVDRFCIRNHFFMKKRKELTTEKYIQHSDT